MQEGELNDLGDPGNVDFAGDDDGFEADADYMERFPVARSMQRGGRRIEDAA